MRLLLKDEGEMASFLDLIPNAGDGVVDIDDQGQAKADHTYWHGFAPRTAAGLRFETLAKGE